MPFRDPYRCTAPPMQLQTNDFAFSIGGVGEGVATEGHLILSDLLVPPIYSQGLHWWACKVGPWAPYTEQKCASQPHRRRHLYANPPMSVQRGWRRRSGGMKCAATPAQSPRGRCKTLEAKRLIQPFFFSAPRRRKPSDVSNGNVKYCLHTDRTAIFSSKH